MVYLLQLLIVLAILISLCKVYEKAGRKCWEGIVPIYNAWVLAEIVGKQGWLGLLIFVGYVIPVIGWIASLLISAYLLYLLAKSFGKDALFAVGLFILPFIFLPILAFGEAQYQGVPTDDIGGNLLEK